MTADLHTLELLEVSALLTSGEVSPVELLEAQLERIAELEPDLGAYALLLPERARQQARRVEQELARGQRRGPLHGVPLGIKDIFDIAGFRTQAGMPVRAEHVAETSATVVTRLEEAGAVLLGKQHLTEGVYAEYVPPFRAPRNPWDPRRCAGRSSSGSAVAVAAGLGFGSLGSDTAGSIRMPAANNGVTGLKPTWGRVSRHGTVELAATLDHIGPIARSAADAAALLQVVAGPDPRDPTASQEPVPGYLDGDTGSLAGVRVGLDEEWISTDVDSETVAATRGAADALVSLGAEVVPVRFPDPSELIVDLTGVCSVQTAVAHADTYPARREEYGSALAELLDAGYRFSAMDYQRLLLRRAEYRGRLEALMATADLLLVPALAHAGMTVERMARFDEEVFWSIMRFTAPFTMSGHPTLTVPGGFTADGTPVGVQLTGRLFGEQELLRAGRAFQTVTDWHRRRPDLGWRAAG